MLSYKITFYINPTGEDKSPIHYVLQLNRQKIEIATGLCIESRFWDEQKQAAKGCLEAHAINCATRTITSTIIEAITKLQLSEIEVTIDNLKMLMKGETILEPHYLIKVTDEHNRTFEKQIGVKYSYGSFKNYKTTLRFLKEFVYHHYKKQDILLKDVNHNFCEQYFLWLTTIKTCKQNGAGKHLQRLKKIMNYSVKMGYLLYNPTQSYTVTIKSLPKVALSWDEIVKIQSLTLETKTLRDIRNIFIFQIFTGLAYSDVKALSKKHLTKGHDGRIWVRMERTKTDTMFTVPLLQPALEILQMYMDVSQGIDDRIFPVLSNQKTNQNLKTIQKLSGIDKNFHTHIARHTFATTVTLLNGVPIETVSKMLGHSKLAMTQVYAKVGELKIAKDMTMLDQKLDSSDFNQTVE